MGETVEAEQFGDSSFPLCLKVASRVVERVPLFARAFWRSGISVMFPVWLAVISHFFLDLPIHPKNLALYPHSSVHLGWGLWRIGATNYWWVQLCVVIALTSVYALGARILKFTNNLIVASCILVLGLHLMTWP
jgi:hypothetical protein